MSPAPPPCAPDAALRSTCICTWPYAECVQKASVQKYARSMALTPQDGSPATQATLSLTLGYDGEEASTNEDMLGGWVLLDRIFQTILPD